MQRRFRYGPHDLAVPAVVRSAIRPSSRPDRSRRASPPRGRELCRTLPRDASGRRQSCEVRPSDGDVRGRGRAGLSGGRLCPALRPRCTAGWRGPGRASTCIVRWRSPGARGAGPAAAAAGHPQRRGRRVRQGRSRQVDDGRQPGPRLGRATAPRRACSMRTSTARASRACWACSGQRPVTQRRQAHRAARGARRQGHVDRLPDRRGAADGVARTDGHAGAACSSSTIRTGASSTIWSSTCRRAPATSS